MPKTKSGEVISWKEFGSRWKRGIQAVTPLQQTGVMLFGYIISLIGIIWGIVFAIYFKFWWLSVILLGSVIVTGTQLLGSYQRYLALKKMANALKGGLDE